MPIIKDEEIWKQIIKEATTKPSKEAIERNKKALELLKKIQSE